MQPTRWRHSLKYRIVVSYSLILILGGLSTSMIGIYVTGRALLRQAEQQAAFGLSLARAVYSHRVEELQLVIDMLASSGRLKNALDAGATHISITIEEAGKRLIEVADNGAGITADEIPLAVTRHATSKLTSAEDLFRIETLGFRGEALASIGSVSRMTITSRPKGAEMGTMMQVDGGHNAPPLQGDPEP